MISTEDLQRLVRDLGNAIGFELELVEESLIVEGEYLATTARSLKPSTAWRPVILEALKLDPGRQGASRWVAKGWEADVYEEWTGLERLE